jgi:beta-phosphoglucomutase-like phosphatase (HAD superfamily)
MYLELTRRLNVEKNLCIIFEDSISGVRAAVAAEIKCIGVLTSAKKETLEQYGTWRTVKNFEDVDLDEIWDILQTK